jgi:hypothetical protein
MFMPALVLANTRLKLKCFHANLRDRYLTGCNKPTRLLRYPFFVNSHPEYFLYLFSTIIRITIINLIKLRSLLRFRPPYCLDLGPSYWDLTERTYVRALHVRSTRAGKTAALENMQPLRRRYTGRDSTTRLARVQAEGKISGPASKARYFVLSAFAHERCILIGCCCWIL